jgi:hypothetical protein
MKCYYCNHDLTEDLFGNLCSNEECESIDGAIKVEFWPDGSKSIKKVTDTGDLESLVEFKDRKEWYLNGQLHREDGPAVEFLDGTIEFWFDGKKIIEIGLAK